MDKKEFLAEIEELSKQPPYELQVVEKIKSHNLPVIIFGASKLAEKITQRLNSFGVKISGYAVDKEYYKPNLTYLGLPVYNFNDLYKTPDKYIFLLGVGAKADDGKRSTDFLKDRSIKKYFCLSWLRSSFIDTDYVLKNQDKFLETYNLLADDFSKKTMTAYLKAHITDDFKNLCDVVVTQDQYFNELTLSTIGGSYVDCGAYDGDSVEAFINFVGDGNYKKIFAIEADPENFAKMENLVREKNYKNVELINCGVWNEKGTITFKSAGRLGSKIVDDGDITVPTDTIDNIVGDENISLIKMDIEGAELNALKGAVKTLERCKPILAICVYHKKEDLITLPQFIKNIYGDCKFYLHKHGNILFTWDLILYVIPN